MADVKLPGARQAVVVIDPQTQVYVLTRPWYLFFQALWQAQGGLGGDTAPLGGTSDISVLTQISDMQQTPLMSQHVQQEMFVVQIDALRDQVAELSNTVTGMQQSTITI